jgi:hypothetical protein
MRADWLQFGYKRDRPEFPRAGNVFTLLAASKGLESREDDGIRTRDIQSHSLAL